MVIRRGGLLPVVEEHSLVETQDPYSYIQARILRMFEMRDTAANVDNKKKKKWRMTSYLQCMDIDIDISKK